MRKNLETYRSKLRARGLRSTPQREEIWSYLQAAGKHLGSDELYSGLRRKAPGIGRATVFRTLKLLEECGLASHVTFADGSLHFESAEGRRHHDHMICVVCGAAIEFESPAIERIQTQAARKRGFRILWHRHEMFGRCARCNRSRRLAPKRMTR